MLKIKTLHIFIISWPGQHENSVSIAKEVHGAAENISIVYSDPGPDLNFDTACEVIRRPNELFWGDKFRACLDTCDAEIMLVIHGDCVCDDWVGLVNKCRRTLTKDSRFGVWTPQIDGTFLNINKVVIASVQSTSLSIVAQTDAIVFSFSRPVIERMRLADYRSNIYGWGIDDMAAAYTFSNNMLVVGDSSVSVKHPESRGYPEEIAISQKTEFLKQLTPGEVVQHRLLKSFIFKKTGVRIP